MATLSSFLGALCVIHLAVGCGQGTMERRAEGDIAIDASEWSAPSAAAIRDRAAAAPAPIVWRGCGGEFECAYFQVPHDYTDPSGPTLRLALTRLPARDRARRIGSLFVNFGGPGSPAVSILRSVAGAYLGAKNPRFDIVGVDPRGTGETEGAIGCEVDPELLGPDAQPFFTADDLDLDLAALEARAQGYVDACLTNNDPDDLLQASTANTARDLDAVRAALGEERLSYLGLSYGSVLGATYAALFPDNYRALVLDGGLDVDAYTNDRELPLGSELERREAFERALERFFQACAADQAACSSFGGDDPARAFEELVAEADRNPIPSAGPDPRPIDGDDVRVATVNALYRKQSWRALAAALADARLGDGTSLRRFANHYYGRRDDGSHDPSYDSFVILTALESRADRDTSDAALLTRNELTWQAHPRLGWGSADWELIEGLFPLRARNTFRGPFRLPPEAAPVLVVGTTFDPATPYGQAERLVAQLENARLLTLNGDGHTAYGDNSPCIDAAVEAYLADGTLPELGAECEQNAAFGATAGAAATAHGAAAAPVLH
jgi:pimeloyl-ACP methyl ester carboxylesterase